MKRKNQIKMEYFKTQNGENAVLNKIIDINAIRTVQEHHEILFFELKIE